MVMAHSYLSILNVINECFDVIALWQAPLKVVTQFQSSLVPWPHTFTTVWLTKSNLLGKCAPCDQCNLHSNAQNISCHTHSKNVWIPEMRGNRKGYVIINDLAILQVREIQVCSPDCFLLGGTRGLGTRPDQFCQNGWFMCRGSYLLWELCIMTAIIPSGHRWKSVQYIH